MEVVFRVSDWFDGRRVHKNFPTRAERDVFEIQKPQGETGVRPTITRLTEEELHEAEAVIRRLAGKAPSFSFYVGFVLANYREPLAQKLLTEAATEFLAFNNHECEQDLISEPYANPLTSPMPFMRRQSAASQTSSLAIEPASAISRVAIARLAPARCCCLGGSSPVARSR